MKLSVSYFFCGGISFFDLSCELVERIFFSEKSTFGAIVITDSQPRKAPFFLLLSAPLFALAIVACVSFAMFPIYTMIPATHTGMQS